ncbi:MAG: uncharacterized protein JWO04_5344 [Gammaproteobacteria bacterium]|jgi:hypothetical protein|nr:uncharacterized protein [Gammaproteobacteria bacterium]
MHVLVLILILAATLVDCLVQAFNLVGYLRLIPEVFSLIAVIVILMRGVRYGFAFVAPKYWFVFGLLSVIILCGILTNDVGSGPTLAGMRSYLRAIPLFLLPAVYPFTDKQLQQQIKLILAIALIQIPITVYQRYVIYSAQRFSGDDVRGTLVDSGVLSIFLICCTLLAVGFMMKNRVNKWHFVILFFALLFPTMIDETKATVLLLPAGLLTTIAAGSPAGKRLKVLAAGAGLLVAFAAILIPVYDAMEVYSPYKGNKHIEDFFTNQQEMDKYMNSTHVGVGTTAPVRRGDALKVPMQYLSRDPVHLAFGLGLGNASTSNLGQAFSGNYAGLFKSFVILSVTVFILEVGLLGTALVFLLYWLVFRDAIAVARSDSGLVGSMAVGWIGVVVVITLATFYSAIHLFASLSYMFWYFSGIIAARRMQLAAEVSRSSTAYPLAQRSQVPQ